MKAPPNKEHFFHYVREKISTLIQEKVNEYLKEAIEDRPDINKNDINELIENVSFISEYLSIQTPEKATEIIHQRCTEFLAGKNYLRMIAQKIENAEEVRRNLPKN